MSYRRHREDKSVHLESWILYSRESISLTSLVKAGTSAVAHLKENLERTLENTYEPLPESSRVVVQDGFILVPGELHAAFLEYTD